MRWRHRKNDHPAEPSPEEVEATKALSKADQAVEDAESTNEEVTATVRLLNRYGDRNNFADLIREAMGGTR